MPRVIGLLLVALVAALAFAAIAGGGRRPRDGTYRPKPRWTDILDEITGRTPPRPAHDPGLVHVVKRAELRGVRDAFSSAPIDASAPLARCGKCLAIYHETSRAALERENHGRCVVCGSSDLGRVSLVDDE